MKEGSTYLLQVNIIWLLTVFLLLQVDGQIVAILVQNMERLDENNKEEADGVHNTLGNILKFALWRFMRILTCCPCADDNFYQTKGIGSCTLPHEKSG